MTATKLTPAQDLLRLFQMGGPWICQTIYVAAKLALPDHIGDDVVPVSKLAEITGSHEDALYRFCRGNAAFGILKEHEGRCFSVTPMGRTLRSDAPEGLRYGVMLQSGEIFKSWAHVLYTVRTGKPAFDHAFGMNYYDFLVANPEENELFNRTMGETDLPPAIAAAENADFSDCHTIVDLGGGIGTLLAAVLRRYPQARGVVQDLPAGVVDTPARLAELGLADRCAVVGASFFDTVHPGGDAYILSRVLHNWDDEHALKILGNIHQAMAEDGKLVIIDRVLPKGDGLHLSVLSDLVMLVIVGGRERTEDEMSELLAKAGFRVTRLVHGTNIDDIRAQATVEAVRA